MKAIFASAVAVLLAACVVNAQDMTTRKMIIPQDDGDGRLIFNRGLELRDLDRPEDFLMAAGKGKSFATDKFSFQLSNTGFRFRAPKGEDYETLVCLQTCECDDCWYVRPTCDDSCDLCVHVQECHDNRGRQRCMDIAHCPCEDGSFECIPSNTGVTITRELTGTLSRGFFFKDACDFDSGRFDLEPCDPDKQNCFGFDLCESDDNSCCELTHDEGNAQLEVLATLGEAIGLKAIDFFNTIIGMLDAALLAPINWGAIISQILASTIMFTGVMANATPGFAVAIPAIIGRVVELLRDYLRFRGLTGDDIAALLSAGADELFDVFANLGQQLPKLFGGLGDLEDDAQAIIAIIGDLINSILAPPTTAQPVTDVPMETTN